MFDETHDPLTKALYSPEKGMIACPSLQRILGGDPRLPYAFPRRDWLMVPCGTLLPMEERMSLWEALACHSRARRITLAEEAGVREKILAREMQEIASLRAAAAAYGCQTHTAPKPTYEAAV